MDMWKKEKKKGERAYREGGEILLHYWPLRLTVRSQRMREREEGRGKRREEEVRIELA